MIEYGLLLSKCMLRWPRSGPGTHSPFAVLHKSDSYRGFISRVLTVARPVSFDPEQTLHRIVQAVRFALLAGSRRLAESRSQAASSGRPIVQRALFG